MRMTQRIEAWWKRLERARAIVAAGGVVPDGPGRFLVTDVTKNGDQPQTHTVFRGQCDCTDCRLRPWLLGYCKHRLAVELYLAQQHEQIKEPVGTGTKERS